MVVAPLFLLAATVIHPASDTDEAAMVANIAANLDAWYASHLLALVSIVVMVPALLGLMHMLREREVTLGHVGGGLAMVGLFAYTAIVAIEIALWQMAGSDPNAAVALLEGMNESPGIAIPIGLGSLLFAVGTVCLAVGLYRARALQSWMAISVAAGTVLLAIAGLTAMSWMTIVAAAFLVVGLGSIGRKVLCESDEAWEHTPEYEGFRCSGCAS